MELRTLPSVVDELSGWLRELVRRRAHGCIRNLDVDVRGETIVIQGRAASYYTKQMATEAVRDELGDLFPRNEIVVD